MYDAKFRGYQPAADWTAQNPVLEQFTFGYETDTGKAKLGDGVTAWNSLGYFDPAGVTASPLVYRALLTQTGTNAPVATVLENTLGGAITWSRTHVGEHRGLLPLTVASIAQIFVTAQDRLDPPHKLKAGVDNNEAMPIQLLTYDGNADPIDVGYDAMPIEILVYP